MMCGDCGERQSFNNIENRRRKEVEKMARWVNLVETNFCDSLREKEFNEGYDYIATARYLGNSRIRCCKALRDEGVP